MFQNGVGQQKNEVCQHVGRVPSLVKTTYKTCKWRMMIFVPYFPGSPAPTVLQCPFLFLLWRNEARCQQTSRVVQDRGLCARLSITVHYKIFLVFKGMLVMPLYEKIILP